jgi:hypothetical protein
VAHQVLEKKDRDVMEMMQKMKGIPGMGGLTMCCPAVHAPRLPLEYPLIPLKYPFQTKWAYPAWAASKWAAPPLACLTPYVHGS